MLAFFQMTGEKANASPSGKSRASGPQADILPRKALGISPVEPQGIIR